MAEQRFGSGRIEAGELHATGFWLKDAPANQALHLTGPALRFSETSRSLLAARQVNAVVRCRSSLKGTPMRPFLALPLAFLALTAVGVGCSQNSASELSNAKAEAEAARAAVVSLQAELSKARTELEAL